jgi:type IV secretory pathway VirB2 component (pilin)
MTTLQRLYVSTGMMVTSVALAIPNASAQIFGPTGDVLPGAPDATNSSDIRRRIIDILQQVLNFLALIAVIVIIIAGIRLILSQGEDDAKDKAKKTIIYVVAGLVVILLAKVIVNFVTTLIIGN